MGSCGLFKAAYFKPVRPFVSSGQAKGIIVKHIYGVGEEVMHSINVRLYPNYLPGYEKTYLARTVNDASLSIEDVCTSLAKRGGFTGEYKDLVNHVKQYLNEVIYQICDGYAVNNGYYSIYPNVGGTFSDTRSPPDQEKNPLTIRFQPLKPLRDAIKAINIVNQGLADTNGHIAEFTDTDENTVNSVFVPGNAFVLTGDKIKVVGEDPECGLFFVPVNNPSGAVKVTRIIENNPSKIIGITPDVGSNCRLEVRTQYSNSTVTLKNIRSITGDFVLEAA